MSIPRTCVRDIAEGELAINAYSEPREDAQGKGVWVDLEALCVDLIWMMKCGDFTRENAVATFLKTWDEVDAGKMPPKDKVQ